MILDNQFCLFVIGNDDHEQILKSFSSNSEKILIDSYSKYKKKYEEEKITIIEDENGIKYPYWDARWFREPSEEEIKLYGPFNKGNRQYGKIYVIFMKENENEHKPLIFEIPENFKKVKGTANEVFSFKDYLTNFIGFRTTEFITNENSIVVKNGEVESIPTWIYQEKRPKFSSYILGGRYRGIFKLKNQKAFQTELGEPEIVGGKWKTLKEGYVSSAFKKDVDFDCMVEIRERELNGLYDRINQHISPYIKGDVTSLHQMLINIRTENRPEEIIKIKENFYDQDIMKAFKEAIYQEIKKERCPLLERVMEIPNISDYRNQFDIIPISDEYLYSRFNIDEFLLPKPIFMELNIYKGVVPHAVIKDGVWYEYGEKNWWGFTEEDKSIEEWTSLFWSLIDKTTDDTKIAVYTCYN